MVFFKALITFSTGFRCEKYHTKEIYHHNIQLMHQNIYTIIFKAGFGHRTLYVETDKFNVKHS